MQLNFDDGSDGLKQPELNTYLRLRNIYENRTKILNEIDEKFNE